MPILQNASVKKYPLVRLLAPLVAGIILQWYLQFSITIVLSAAIICFAAFIFFQFASNANKFFFSWLQGILLSLFFIFCGCILVYAKDIRHSKNWQGNFYKPSSNILITLEEPLLEKPNSWKAQATVNAVKTNDGWQKTTGEILVYFKKDSAKPNLNYGSQLLLRKDLQPITNSGNPGAFDYNRYCLFHDITGQVFLTVNDYVVANTTNKNWLQQLLIETRNVTINIIQKYINGKKEQGLLEALMIGYQNDLDKELVQAYSNTGVVHIIAISGLHLGMIYLALLFILSPFKQKRWYKWVKPVFILFVLWSFTLIAGAVPSILRSAVMFTFIIIGESLNRKTNIYNTLAASAFCMLVYNPFFLWDVGFLLSYAAVISIISFQRYIYKWFYFKNKIGNFFWQLTSVTIAAQVLTLPVILFYFHQLPTYFLLTNFVVVPFSGLVLGGGVLLIIISFIPVAATYAGIVVKWMIFGMNWFVEKINQLPFSIWDNIKINVVQTYLLYGVIICICWWLIQKMPKAFVYAFCFLAAYIISLSVDVIAHQSQQKLIVYNVSKQTAIDVMQGAKYNFIGDSILLQDAFLRNFNLKPSRIQNRVSQDSGFTNMHFFIINNTKFLLYDKSISNTTSQKLNVDILILSKNPQISVSRLQQQFQFTQIVFDSSNPLWKIQRWKKECDSLHLRCYSVPQQGAFVMNL